MSQLGNLIPRYADDARALRLRGYYQLAAYVEWTLRRMVVELFGDY